MTCAKALLCLAILSTLGACAGAKPGPGADATKPSSAASESAERTAVYITSRDASPEGGTVQGGVKLRSPGDVEKLIGAPDDFKAFLAKDLADGAAAAEESLARLHTTADAYGCDELSNATVWGVTNQVAMGSTGSCAEAGGDVIWAKRDGTWKSVSGNTTGSWPCSELRLYGVPAQITVARCVTDMESGTTQRYDGPDR
jgi:hypothetical protein